MYPSLIQSASCAVFSVYITLQLGRFGSRVVESKKLARSRCSLSLQTRPRLKAAIAASERSGIFPPVVVLQVGVGRGMSRGTKRERELTKRAKRVERRIVVFMFRVSLWDRG